MRFHQAVIDCAAVGIIIVDDDTRIIKANREALRIIGKSSIELLNFPIIDLFANGKRGKIVNALKRVAKQKELEKVSVSTNFQSQAITTNISQIECKGKSLGWVFALEHAKKGNAQTLGNR